MMISEEEKRLMVHKMMGAAQSNDIKKLYQLIGEQEDVLKWFDEMEFADTPLHIAAAAGNTNFANEMMYLKPSFAKKLNKKGWSPIHLALKNKQTKLAVSLLKADKSLANVKGKKGYTPLHCLLKVNKEEDRERERDHLKQFLKQFLDKYPHCIGDVTNEDETPLHVAARYNSRALKVLLHWFTITNNYSMMNKQTILDAKNSDDETVLHVAVSSNNQPDPETVRLLRNLWIDIQAENGKGSTALQILRARENSSDQVRECVNILGQPCVLQFVQKIPWYLIKLLSQWGYEIKNISNETGNVLLVVTVLILTATYTATLSPPGGVLEPDTGSNGKKFSGLEIFFGSNNTSHVVEKVTIKGNNTAGSSVLKKEHFLWFFIPNLVAFTSSFILTCLVLLKLVSGFFSFGLLLSLSTLLFCLLDSAVIIVSPDNNASNILLLCAYVIVCFTCIFIGPVLIPKARRLFVMN